MIKQFKIHILFSFESGPTGGGNQFLKYLKRLFIKHDQYTEDAENADIILFNSHHLIEKVIRYQMKYPEKIFVHRIDGPMSIQRGASNIEADIELYKVNNDLAEATIFQSKYSKEYNKQLGIKEKRFETILYNGADCKIFKRKRNFRLGPKVKIISSCWSTNKNKGFEIYDYIDKHLDFSKFEYTLVGPAPYKYNNIKKIGILSSTELAAELAKHDIYITASLFDPCSNSLLEALAVGLPCIARCSGGHPELIKDQGILFYGRNNIISAIEYLTNNYHNYINKKYFFDEEFIFKNYYNFFQKIISSKPIRRKRGISRYCLYKFTFENKLKRIKGKIFPLNKKLNYDNRVLVLGDSPRACLSVIRSLGEQGIDVDLLTFENKTICRKSKYVKNIYYFEDFSQRNPEWVKNLKQIIIDNAYGICFPTSDKYLLPIFENKELFSAITIIAIPNDKGIIYSFNKNKTLKVVQELNIPTPKTIIIKSINDFNNCLNEIQKMGFPIILKPAKSFFDTNRNVKRISNYKIKTLKELKNNVENLIEFTPLLIQEYIRGAIIGQEFIAKNGKIINSFQHLRLHQPLKGGGSSYRKSMPIDEKILEYSKRIIEYLNYDGVLMIEYKYLPTVKEKAKLLEINGRFWGSLPLAKFSGINFPYNLYQLKTGEEVSKYAYRTNRYMRNLTMDFKFLLQNIFGTRKKDSEYRCGILKYFLEVKNTILLKEGFDILSFKDIKPFLLDTYYLIDSTFFSHFKSLLKGVRLKMLLRKQVAKINRIDKFDKILFVCKGNICRSAFAEKYGKLIYKNIRVDSAGYYPEVNRKSPRKAIIAAKEFNVNLNTHLSKLFNHKKIDSKTVVIVFDLKNYNEIKKTDKDLSVEKTFLMSFFNNSIEEIEDPLRKKYSDYLLTYEEIARLMNIIKEKYD